MTPRQFSLLMKAHRRSLAHTEMVGAYTTAAVINYAFAPPKQPVNPSVFMPNLEEKSAPEPAGDPLGEEVVLDWQNRIAMLAAEMRAGGGQMLDEINRTVGEHVGE